MREVLDRDVRQSRHENRDGLLAHSEGHGSVSLGIAILVCPAGIGAGQTVPHRKHTDSDVGVTLRKWDQELMGARVSEWVTLSQNARRRYWQQVHGLQVSVCEAYNDHTDKAKPSKRAVTTERREVSQEQTEKWLKDPVLRVGSVKEG